MGFLRHTVDSIQLANYILAKVGPMPHLKLQKLAYYAQAWHFAYFNEPLIKDDFQAWLHGPVSKKLWNNFKSEENPLLNRLEIDPDIADGAKNFINHHLNEEQIDLLNDVLKEYGKRSAYHLECLTHAERPWMDARRGVGIADKCSNVISTQTMVTFYRTKALKQ